MLPEPVSITPLNIYAWESYLKFSLHCDKEWVLEGLRSGFNLEAAGGPLKSADSNCRSTKLHSTVVSDYLQVECRLGAFAGPFSESPCDELHINRFGVIPKSTPGKWRLITDLSFPKCFSVNDLIPYDLVSVKYVGIPEAIGKIISLGHATLLAKFDIRRAYRLLPVRREDRHFLGMRWNVDLAIPFGLRSAPRIFTRFADVLQSIFQVKGHVSHIQHYLDDFLLLGRPKSSERQESLARCFSIMSGVRCSIG